ncbi:MAG: hypothetical protein J5803_05975 [Desulfovibrio sp.]|nr:hypothetical protein [Desulfovibrio sp.]
MRTTKQMDEEESLLYEDVFDDEDDGTSDDELCENSYTSDSHDDPLGSICDMPDEEVESYRKTMQKG